MGKIQLKWVFLGALALLIAVGGFFYWQHSQHYPSTDDAYVNAHVVQVAPQVTGPVAQTYVSSQQFVHKGDALFDIDRTAFNLAVTQAQARLALARHEVGADTAAVAAAAAEVQNQEVRLRNAEKQAQRVGQLRQQGFVSAQAHDDAIAAVDAAKAQAEVARAKLNQARMALGSQGGQNEHVRAAQAALEQTQLDLAHTHIAAACNGRVADFSLRPGNIVRINMPLFALVCDEQYWIDANFKETQVARIRPGQDVEVSVDTYPGLKLRGKVENLSSASGAAFSLMPPQNATGNWVKITQRVPVRIVLLNVDAQHPLRVGTSALVTVDTVHTPAAAR